MKAPVPLESRFSETARPFLAGLFSPSDSVARKIQLRAVWIAVVYALFAAAWIYSSDHLLSLIVWDREALFRFSIFKGFAFVMATALLLLFLMHLAFRAILENFLQLKSREEEVHRLSRLNTALSQVNQAILWEQSSGPLLQKICRVLVDFGGLKVASIGRMEASQEGLQPMAWAAAGENASLPIFAGKTNSLADESIRQVLRTQQPVVYSLPSSATIVAAHDKEKPLGQASGVFPIRMQGQLWGVLTVYADAISFFQKEEQALLVEAAADISFALDNFARRDAEMQAKQELQASEERFNAFMDATPAIAWITDPEGRHLFMNRAWEEAFGLLGREWHGKTAFDLVAKTAADQIQATDQLVLRDNRPVTIPEEVVVLQEQTHYWNCIKFPFQNSSGQRFIGGIAIDITARKNAEKEKLFAEGRYQALFNHAPDGILIADGASRYLDANPSMCAMLGYTRSELIGLHASDILDPREIQRVGPTLQTLHQQNQHHEEWNFRRKNGSTFPAEVIVTLLPDGNLLAMVRDITLRHQAEHMLRTLNQTLEEKVAARTEELQTALTRAEAADRLKSAFLATMSHELRTPLNSIIGFTGILAQGLAGPVNSEQSKQLGMVRRSAGHLLALINDVLDISKIEAGQLELQMDFFAVQDLLEDVVEIILPLAKSKELTLRMRCEASLGSIRSDRRRVEQILLNLLNNAVKFTETGGVLLVASIDPDSPASPGGWLKLQVSDTGVGIHPQDLNCLFQPFRQLDSGLARQYEGTGLGLAISQKLTALLGGKIFATSDGRSGSTFTVLLPLEAPPSS